MMTADQGDTMERLDVPVGSIGFEPPPSKVNLKFLYAAGRWTLYLHFQSGEAEGMQRWIETYGPDNVIVSPGVFPRVLRADFQELPPQWERMASDDEIHLLSLLPEGIATILVRSTGRSRGMFVKSLQGPDAAPKKIRVEVESHPRRKESLTLTAKQEHVLSVAVSLGYYDVPHRVGLRALAVTLGRSTGTISELLRRAESKIITQHVTQALVNNWEADRHKERKHPPTHWSSEPGITATVT